MPSAHMYQFGPFHLDCASRLLWRDGKIVSLAPKVVDVLVCLVESRNRLVTKDEMMGAVWPDSFVEESNLTSYLSILRKNLGERLEGGEYIETIPKRGYRFVAPVQSPTTEAAPRRTGFPPLAWALAAALFVIIAAAGAIWKRSRHQRTGAIRSVAVLPFVNLSSDHANEYFSDGLTEELIDSLSKVEGLEVVARTSVFQFKNKAMDIRHIGAQLNVQAVLEGSVRKQGEHLRVTAQLNKVADGYHLWSRTYDREAKDAFAVQEEIAGSIASALRQNEPVKRRVPTQETHDLYLQARYHHNRNLRSEVDKAIALYQRTIAKDPSYAAAWAGLAHAYITLGFSGELAPADTYPKAAEAAGRALTLDPLLADAHAMQGMVNLVYRWDWTVAERELLEAIRLDPSYAVAHHWYSHFLVVMGKFPQSLEESKRAIQIDPLGLPITAHLGWHYLYSRQYSSAIAALQHSIELDSRQFWGWEYLRRAYEFTNGFDDAIDALGHSGVPRDDVSALRQGLRTSGPKGYWSVRLKQALNPPAGKYVRPLYMSQLFLRLGEKERALDSLEQGFRVRDDSLVYLKRDPAFDGIRDDPRFISLARRVGLP